MDGSRVYFFIALGLLFMLGGMLVYFAWTINHTLESAYEANVRKNVLLSQLGAPLLEEHVDSPIAKLVFVGDIMLSRAIGRIIEKTGDPGFPFARIAQTIQSANLAIANLENPVSVSGTDQGSVYSFRADPNVIVGLAATGFDIVSLANNHMLDWGSDAVRDTIDTLRLRGIESVGAGETIAQANAPVIRVVHGMRVGFLSHTTLYRTSQEARETYGVSATQPDAILANVRALKESKKTDVIVVLMHWGDEYEVRASAAQRDFARQLIAAGANVVIGHHPHVAQEVEQVRGAWVAYSLGNFVFDQNFSEDTRTGLLLEVLLQKGAVIQVTPRKIRFSEQFQPFLEEQ